MHSLIYASAILFFFIDCNICFTFVIETIKRKYFTLNDRYVKINYD